MTSRNVYEFEGFRLDTHTQTLQSPVDGGQIALKPKEFDTLLFFIQHSGELIDKETLMQALWPDQDVEENNLNQYVTALRKILGEEKGGRRFIMNVRAKGYKFVPEVLELDADKVVTRTESGTGKTPTKNLAAWQCYQQAVHLQNADHPDRWYEALTVFEQAIKLDPEFAAAYALLSLTRIRLFMLDHPGAAAMLEPAQREARTAVELRPSAADGYMALGAINAARGQWVEAELNYLSAHQLGSEWLMPPSMHPAHLLLSVGHLRRALEAGRESLADVKGVTRLVSLHATTAALADEDEEARETIEMAKAMGARVSLSPTVDVLSLLAQRGGDFDGAARALYPSLNTYMREMGTEAVISGVFTALKGEAPVAEAVSNVNALVAKVDLDRMPQNTRRQVLLWYTQLEALDEAFAFANRCLDFYRQYGIVGIAWGNLWLKEMKPFRADPRFNDFVERMKLPDYWKTFGSPDGHQWKKDGLIVL